MSPSPKPVNKMLATMLTPAPVIAEAGTAAMDRYPVDHVREHFGDATVELRGRLTAMSAQTTASAEAVYLGMRPSTSACL